MEYPYHIDSAMMVLRTLLPGQQGVNRAKVLNLMGVSHDIKGQYDSAAYYLYDAMRIVEEVKDDSLQISIYTNLGMLQYALKNGDESITYYQKALPIAEKIHHAIAIANLLNNIGNTYMTLMLDFDKAIYWLERCRDVSMEMGYVDGCRTAGFNLAQIYNEMGELDKAKSEINRIIELYGYDRFGGYLLGVIDFKKGNWRQAIQTFQGLLVGPLITREFELEIYKTIAETYKASGHLDSTVFYLEKSYALRDSLHNQQKDRTINELKIGYETEKKEALITVLKGEKKLMIWLSITGIILFLIVLTAMFFLWRWTVQKRRLTERQIKQLEQEKQLVAAQAVLDGEMQERIRIARDLHDSLGSILAGTKLNLQEMKKGVAMDDKGEERYHAALALLDDSVREMRRVSHHLMPDTLSRYGLKAAIGDFCATLPSVKYAWYGDESRLPNKQEESIYRITHELVSNALKHSGATQILVEIVRYDNTITLTVQDNGCGFDPSAVSRGVGLNNVRNRVAAYNGNLMVDSKPEVGTEVNVELKIDS